MVESAGFVIIDFGRKDPRVLCLYNEWGQWDFPKGRLKPGESHFEAAARETREESQLNLAAGDFQPIDAKPFSVTYRSGREAKTATYFFAERISANMPELLTNPEIGKPEHIMWEWINVAHLYDRLPRRLDGLILAIEDVIHEMRI